MRHFGVTTWQEVLAIFESGLLAGRWGWLEVLRTAELGDEIRAYGPYDKWYGTAGPGTTTRIAASGRLTADANGRLSLVSGTNTLGADAMGQIGEAYDVLFSSHGSLISRQLTAVLYANQKYYHLRAKEADRVDWGSAAIDAFGIAGDIAFLFPGVGTAIWFASEVPELLTVGTSFDQMETGDPTGLAVDIGILVAQGVRLAPQGGWFGNVAGLGFNFFEWSP